MSSDAVFTCPRCQVGLCRPGLTTYARMIGDQLLSIPNMPAYICDVCGYREYDREILMDVQAMVGEFEQPIEETPPAAKRPAVDSLDLPETNPIHRPKS